MLSCCTYMCVCECVALQELEQGKHDLRLKLEGCQSQWESQVGDLERDVRELSVQVEQLTQALSTSERDMTRAQQEHQEHTQHLREQLNTVSHFPFVTSLTKW